MITRRNFIGAAAVVAAIPFTAFGAVPDGQINVRDFGAIGDGVADDTAAIQAAIDATPKSVFFPAGTYRCNLVIRVNANMVGAFGVTLTGVTTAPVISVKSGSFSMANFHIVSGPASYGLAVDVDLSTP